jgi:membrane-associated phospholipid phosphatase
LGTKPSRLVLALIAALALPLPLRAQEGPPSPAESAPPESAPPKDKPPSDDGRRTFGRFFPNLGRNAVLVFSKDNLAPFLVSAGAAGGGSFFDDDVQRYFTEKGRRVKWLGDSGDQLGQGYVIGPIAAALYGAGRLSGNQRFRDATYDIAQVTLVAVTYTMILKFATHRRRPDGSDNLSFPSGHASNAFAWATVGASHYGWKLGVPGYLLAGLIGVSRMEKNAHHLSDVLAGAGIGYIVGRTAVKRDGKPVRGKPIVRLNPALDPKGAGAGLALSLRF